MANLFEQIDWIAAEALMHLEDALVIANLAAKDKSSDFNTSPNGYKVGDTVRIKTRPEYKTTTFADINSTPDGSGTIEIQDIKESTRNLSIERLFDVSVNVTAKERALDMESFSEQVIMPAAYTLAESVDIYCGTKILQGAGLYVPAGASAANVFADAADMAEARKTATEQQLSQSGRFCLAGLTLEARLLGATYFGTWNNRGPDGQAVFTNGNMGHAMGMDFYSTTNFPALTLASSTAGGTFETDNGSGGNTNNQIGATTLTIANTATGNLVAGARLLVAGTKRPLKVATAIANLATGPTTEIALVDPITEIIDDDAAITVVGDGVGIDIQGAIFDDRSLAIAMPILDPPSDKPAFSTSNNGVSIRVVQGYDMTTKTETLSMDLLVGANAYDPRRITLLGDNLG